MRKVIVFKVPSGEWVAECPSLPGCKCRAADKVAALDAIKHAIDQYILELKSHDAPIPPDTAEVSVVLV
ncbi:MAG: type II toxin-antitoxin system HicB family antitoxin [Chloroflexota bacterium]